MEDLQEEPELEEEEAEHKGEVEPLEETKVDMDEEDSQKENQKPELVKHNSEFKKPDVLTRPTLPVRLTPPTVPCIINARTKAKNGRVGKKALLQTNFSVTGLNEIKTEQIPTEIEMNFQISGQENGDNNSPPSRPVSLHLKSTFSTFKPQRPGSMLVEKVTTKMIDLPKGQ